MSGAVFTMLANEGKADGLIMATALLTKRLQDIIDAKIQRGDPDPTPTIADIEQSHIMFISARYQPFATIASEYQKARSQSGTSALNTEIQFAIPPGGDFWHDMVFRALLGEVQAGEFTVPAQPATAQPAASVFPPEKYLADGSTAAVGTFYNLVDAFGTVVVAGDDAGSLGTATHRNLIRYCEYPGERLPERVSLDIGVGSIDQYSYLVSAFLRKFTLMPHKETAYKRLCGQETAIRGYAGPKVNPVTDNDGTGPDNIYVNTQNHGKALFESTGKTYATIIPSGNVYDYSHQERVFFNGPQTPKWRQPPLEIWHKIKMFFSEDVRLSIPSVCIPWGNRYITIRLAAADQMVFEFCNLYLETITDSSADGKGTRTRTKTYTPLYYKAATPTIAIQALDLYVNNIYVNPDVHDIFLRRISFTLIRVYKEQITNVKDASGEVQINQIKYPVEYMFIGMRPKFNVTDTTVSGGAITAGNKNMWRDWHRMCKVLCGKQDNTTTIDLSSNLVVEGAPARTAVGGAAVHQIVPEEYPFEVPTMDTLKFVSHGMTIFDAYTDAFYNSYIPFHAGADTIVSPEDPGAFFVNFALFPRIYQPSGHYNCSRARENIFQYTTRCVNSVSSADFICVAIAINFILVSDGTINLRYTT